MKKISAIVLFFCTNALLIFFEVHKQGQLIKVSYEIQKHQTTLSNLKKEKRAITFKLLELQQPNIIKEFAKENLNMQPIQLKNVKKAHENNKLY